MTEAEWLACDDPQKMLEFVRGKASERKWQLVACATVRRLYRALANVAASIPVSMAREHLDDTIATFNSSLLEDVERRADDGRNSENTPAFINLFRRAVGRQWLIGTTEYRFSVLAAEVTDWA